jgi:hypothetical protein
VSSGFSLQIDRAEAVQQAMLHREQRGGRAGRCAGVGVDALDVGLRRLGRDAQGAGDLPGGRAAGDEGKDLDLAGGEPGGPGAPPGPVLPGRQHGINGIGCQAAGPDLRAQFVSGLLERQSWPVRPGLAPGAAGVGDGEDPAACGDRRPGQAAVVAGPVQALIGQ